MAQPSYAIEYLGAKELLAGTDYTTASLLSEFPNATVIRMKSSGIKVGINGGVMFPVDYGEESYLVTGKTFRFDNPCIVAIGIYKAVV